MGGVAAQDQKAGSSAGAAQGAARNKPQIKTERKRTMATMTRRAAATQTVSVIWRY